MKTWIKRISIGLAVLLAVVVVGLAVFLLTFDPNAYKDRIQAWVQERYHRTLTIEGDIEATLFPRLGLALEGVSLSEPGSTETFAAMDSARVSVAIWPLLSRHVVVDHASFSGVKARVVRDKQGRLNFQDLIGGGAAEPDAAAQGAPAPREPAGPAGGSGEPSIDIAGLDIKDGEIQLRDEASGRALTISQVSAKTGRVRTDQPFDVSLSAHVEGASPLLNADIAGQAAVRLDPRARRYEARKLDLKVAGQLPGATARNLTARGDLVYEEATRAIDAAELEIVFQGDVADVQGGTASMDASLAAQRLRVDPAGDAIQAAKVAVRAKGEMPDGPFEFAADAPALDVSPQSASGGPLTARLRMSGDNGVDMRLGIDGISGNSGKLAAAEAKLSAQIKQPGRGWTVTAASPLAADIGKRSGALSSLAGEAVIAGPGLPEGGLRIPYTGAAQLDLGRATADARLNAQVDGGKLDLTAGATGLGAKPALRFAVDADTLDLDKLMPAQGSARAAPAAPAKAPAPAASGQPGAAAGANAGSGGDAAASGGAASSGGTAAPGAGDIDLSALVGPTAQGTIKAGRVVARGVTLQNLTANVKLAQGKLDIAPLAAALYGGKLAGEASVDATRDNAMATRFTLDGVAVGPLLADVARQSALTGTGSVTANVTTHGRRSTGLRDNLAGTVQLRLRDGAVKGFDVPRAVRDLKQAILGGKGGAPTDVPADAARETAFSRMDADLALAAGVATITRLDVASPVLRVSQGSPAVIDLPKGTIDLVANVRIADAPPAYADIRELRGVTVPLHVAGPYDALRYRIDWRAVAGDALSRTLQRALGGKGDDKSHNGDSREETIRDIGKLLRGITGK